MRQLAHPLACLTTLLIVKDLTPQQVHYSERPSHLMDLEAISTALLCADPNQRRSNTLTLVTDLMRKKGASEQSIQTVLTGFDTLFRLTSDPNTLDHPQTTPIPFATRLADLPTQPTHWLWQDRIPLGHLTLLEGEPGSGTSLLATALAAHVSRGTPLLDGTPCPQGTVILIAPHDNPTDSIKPRLEAAGGDPSHVLLLSTIAQQQPNHPTPQTRPFSLAEDLDLLEESITSTHTTLVIIDPLTAVLGRRSTPGIFPRLAQLAQRTNCAILLIRHLSAAPTDTQHTGGPLDLVSAVRSRLLLMPDPYNNQRRLLLTTKHPLYARPLDDTNNQAYDILIQDSHIPTLLWASDYEPPLSSLGPAIPLASLMRQLLFDATQDSDTPLDAHSLADSTGQNYENTRKALQRMRHSGQLVSPARGLYTTPDHPSLAHYPPDTGDIPPDTVPPVPSPEPEPQTTLANNISPVPTVPQHPEPGTFVVSTPPPVPTV